MDKPKTKSSLKHIKKMINFILTNENRVGIGEDSTSFPDHKYNLKSILSNIEDSVDQALKALDEYE